MASRILILALLIAFAGKVAAVPAEHGHCKSTPDAPEWPSKNDWNKLNETLRGNLLAPLPPAIVCDQTRPEYSEEKCSGLNEKWFTAAFHDANPISVHLANWQLDACLPDIAYNKSHNCDLKPFPKYSIQASNSQHVVDAVKFAQQHNIRVSVKNTGHDYIGRSTSPELSIWTHHLKKIDMHALFQPQNCKQCTPSTAITVRSGNQFAEIYHFVKEHNLLIAGGAEPNVGLGGYLTGAGHSPMSAKLGLAADNVLEMEVVTPSGELLIANDCQHSDLFWAMKGGGGSTFGILISATIKTYSDYPGANFTISFSSNEHEATHNNNTNFFELLADLHEELVKWSDNYVNGYSSWAPVALLEGMNPTSGSGGGDDASATGFDSSNKGTTTPATGSQPMLFIFGGWIHNETEQKLHELMSDFVKKINATNGVNGTFVTQPVAKMSDILETDVATAAGYNALLGSRLWPQEALMNRTGLIEVFRVLQNNDVQGLVVSGPAVRDASKADKVSATAAWRKTYLHTLVVSTWGFRNETQKHLVQDLHTNVLTQALRDHAPESGAYINEGDHYEPHPQNVFWSDYDRLLKLKRQYDPNGLLWCVPCVGSEDWELDDQTGKLCKV